MFQLSLLLKKIKEQQKPHDKATAKNKKGRIAQRSVVKFELATPATVNYDKLLLL
jgi:hypothetical protein